jgi:hypothetical protein
MTEGIPQSFKFNRGDATTIKKKRSSHFPKHDFQTEFWGRKKGWAMQNFGNFLDEIGVPFWFWSHQIEGTFGSIIHQ